MSEQNLRAFASVIKQRIDEDRSSEALPMAQYLLRRYPRYLTGYRLLGEAALEQGNVVEAVEIFQRVLSADPEDFVAHAGLAAAYAEQNSLDEAIWHMLRAFEVRPGMREVREQLRYLYELRDGYAPGRLQLNRAALARVYMGNGWYNRAVVELKAELEREGERLDLRSALAVALWGAGQRKEAVRVAADLLEALPFCLKANLILGEFYARSGDLTMADRYLATANQLDPENELASHLFGSTSYLRPRRVSITRLDEEAAGMAVEALPEWLEDLSLFTMPGLGDEDIDWDSLLAHESDWRTRLASATRDELERFRADWRTDLRRATRVAVRVAAEQSPERVPLRRAGWVGSLLVSTLSSLRAYRTDAEWVKRLHGATDDLLEEGAISNGICPATARWVEALRQETGYSLAATHVSESVDEEEFDLPALAVALLEGESTALQEVQPPAASTYGAGDAPWVAHLRAEVNRDLESARDPVAAALPALWEEERGEPEMPERAEVAPQAEDAQPADPVAEPDAAEVAGVAPLAPEEPPAPLEGLPLALYLWEEGQPDEALSLAHSLFSSGEIDGEMLRATLERWVDAADAPARVYQILGDLHRREGRLQEAVAAYRDAINQM
jgi:tetratricopeptide (TPR) repeat protein